MKNQIVCLFAVSLLVLNSNCSSSTNQSCEINDLKLGEITYSDYVGKEVFYFLIHDDIRGYQEFIFFDNKPGVLNGAIITIDPNNYIEIYVSEFKFQKQFNEERKWDKSLFLKEIISRIRVFKDDKCILDTFVATVKLLPDHTWDILKRNDEIAI